MQDEVVIEGEEVTVRQQKGTYCMGSATDPEASFRNHGERDGEPDITLGYNPQVAATKDGLITETQAHTGAKTDQQPIPDLVAEQKEHHGLCPPKLIYDKAGGNGKVRYAVEQASDGQTIVSATLPDYAGRSDRFGPYDFSLSEDDTTLTCPQGKSTDVSYASQSGDGQPELILVADSESGNGRAITLSRGDINEIQMAKGAIRAGQEILLKEAGISAEEVDRVIIAGAFGTYIDVENAVNIGMLPHIPVHRFSQIGNAAGMGAVQALLSSGKREQIQKTIKQVEYIELTTRSEFQKEFLDALYL